MNSILHFTHQLWWELLTKGPINLDNPPSALLLIPTF